MAKYPINTNIAFTYIVSNKKLTFVAALGVVLGIAVYIFMNSLLSGFDKSANDSMFKSTPAIRIYKDDALAQTLTQDKNQLIVNPKVVPQTPTITNPNALIHFLKEQEPISVVMPQLNVSLFYNNGRNQIAGQGLGIVSDEAQKMYNIKSFIVEGDYEALKRVRNGVILGVGVAQKMNAHIGDNINIISSKGVIQNLKVVGLFQLNNSVIDKTRCYLNLNFAQELLQEGDAYITDINVSLKDVKQAKNYAPLLSQMTGYKAEDWETANESMMAAFKMRALVITIISFTILLVAAFGIYNILNMTISQKINDIAILKAIGFTGRDVIRIFVTQAGMIGLMGITIGVLLATVLIHILSNIYVGGDIGFFPIVFDPLKFLQGILFGAIITFFAGYIPAKKAANVDPVSIFRK